MVVMTFVLAAASGAFQVTSIVANRHIIDDGLRVAAGEMTFLQYAPWLALMVLSMMAQPLIWGQFCFGYVKPRSQMILNTSYKGEMLKKLKRMKYEHFENDQSVEIMEKATTRAMNSARHLFLMYVLNGISAAVAAVGLLWQLGSVRWWLLLLLYVQGEITVGALTLMVFGELFDCLGGATGIIRWAGYHIQFTDYYDKFFGLSEDDERKQQVAAPKKFDIEFRDVWFRYPGKEENPYILKGLSFRIREGEKISIVGENGEGKSTMIKLLLLGLLEPERGQILLGGRPIEAFTREQRNRVFAPVFQDFMRYSISLKRTWRWAISSF